MTDYIDAKPLLAELKKMTKSVIDDGTVSPFIDCSINEGNPSAYNHLNMEIVRIEYNRPHSLTKTSLTTLHLLCKGCGNKFIQYIV